MKSKKTPHDFTIVSVVFPSLLSYNLCPYTHDKVYSLDFNVEGMVYVIEATPFSTVA